jgi:membrane protease YdiL (CAAX protease family)
MSPLEATETVTTTSGRRRQAIRKIVTFVGLTFALSSIGYAATIISGETSILLLVAPGLAALITRFAFDRTLRGFGWTVPRPGYLVAAYLLPILVSGSMFVLAWLVAGYYAPDNTDTDVVESFVATATIGVVVVAAFSIGEELGWRGFLVPELAKITSFTNVALISGVIWAVWHWPLIIFAAEVTDFDATPVWFALPVFTITIIAAATVMAWLTLRTGSIWPAIILHGSQNAITQNFFSDYTTDTGNSAYYVSEIGGLIAVAWVATAYLFWRNRHLVERVGASS